MILPDFVTLQVALDTLDASAVLMTYSACRPKVSPAFLGFLLRLQRCKQPGGVIYLVLILVPASVSFPVMLCHVCSAWYAMYSSHDTVCLNRTRGVALVRVQEALASAPLVGDLAGIQAKEAVTASTKAEKHAARMQAQAGKLFSEEG